MQYRMILTCVIVFDLRVDCIQQLRRGCLWKEIMIILIINKKYFWSLFLIIVNICIILDYQQANMKKEPGSNLAIP